MRRVLLPLLLLPLPVWGQTTTDDDGEGFLTELIEEQLSDAAQTVDIQGFDGALSARATIRRLTIADTEGIWLEAEGLALDWDRGALFSGRLDITALTADRISIPRAPIPAPGIDLPTPEATPFALPDLPVSIDIGTLSATRIDLGTGLLGEPLSARLEASASLSGGAGEATLLAQRIDDTDGLFEVAVSYSNATGQLTLDTTLAEEAGGLVSRSLGLPGTPSVRFDIDGSGPLGAFAGDIALATDGTDRISGTFSTAPEGTATRYALDISGDVTTLFDPAYRPFFGDDLTLQAFGRSEADGKVILSALDLRADQIRLSGAAAFGADGWPERLTLDGQIASAAGPVLLPLGGDPTRVDSVDLSVRFNAATGDAWDGTFLIDGLNRPDMSAGSLILSGSGTITPGDGAAIGRLTADLLYQAEALTFADPALALAVPTRFAGEANLIRQEDAPFSIPRLTLAGEDLSVEATARIDGGEIQTTVLAKAEDFSRFAALSGLSLGGAGSVQLTGDIAPLDGAFDLVLSTETTNLTLNEARIDPLLAGTGTVALAAARDTSGLRVQGLTIRTDLARIDGNAALTSEGSAAQLTGTLTDISPVIPGLAGAANLTVEAAQGADKSTRAKLDLALPTGTLSADLQQDATGVLTGDLEAALSRIGAYAALLGLDLGGAASLTASGSFAPDTGDATLTLDGTTDDLRTGRPEIDTLLSGRGSLSLKGAARVDDTPGPEDIANGTFALRYPWVTLSGDLARSGTDLGGTITARVPQLARLRGLTGQALSGAAQLTTTGTFTPGTGAFAADLDGTTTDFGLGNATLNRLTAGLGQISGTVSGDGSSMYQLSNGALLFPNLQIRADASTDGDTGQASYSARLRDVGLFTDALSGPLTADGTASRATGGWRINTVIGGPGGATARIAGLVGQTLGLDITGALPLALLNGVLDPRRLSGTAALALRADGPPGLSSLSGTVSLSDARLAAPTLGQALEAITGQIRLAGGQAQIDLGGSVPAGGQASIRGPISLSAPYTADLTLALQGIVLRDPTLYETRADGGLSISGPLAGGARIAGQIALGQTDIRVPSSTVGALGDLPDVSHVGAPGTVRQTLDRAGVGLAAATTTAGTARPFPLDITVTAPSRIFVRGRGLDAELGGALRLTGTTAAIVPSGEFGLIRGRLDILQQRFDLTEGFARLEGDFVPTLRLVARTEADEGTTIEIIVEGPADAPDVRFVSSPELPQDEVLARLLFGRSLADISPLQAIQLAAAANTLAGRGNGGVISQFRDGLDLDNLDITTDETGNAAVRAGKYISENVYTEITVDSAGETSIDLNIDLTDSLTARGSVGADGETSVGIFFERDY